MEIKITPDELRAIMKEYEYDPDPMNDEDERSLAIKKSMTKLLEAERIIFCLYMELGSSRKLGKFLGGISHSTVLKEINRIKEKIRLNMDGSSNI